MTIDSFRALSLSLPYAIESAHMKHPDFRVGGKIFATLQPDSGLGMVKLTPQQQKALVKREPTVFSPVPGGWGARGATHVHLKSATKAAVKEALLIAWRNTAPKKLLDEIDDSQA